MPENKEDKQFIHDLIAKTSKESGFTREQIACAIIRSDIAVKKGMRCYLPLHKYYKQFRQAIFDHVVGELLEHIRSEEHLKIAEEHIAKTLAKKGLITPQNDTK